MRTLLTVMAPLILFTPLAVVLWCQACVLAGLLLYQCYAIIDGLGIFDPDVVLCIVVTMALHEEYDPIAPHFYPSPDGKITPGYCYCGRLKRFMAARDTLEADGGANRGHVAQYP
jgi:hypothetical protein